MQYPKERKEAVLAKLMPPYNRIVVDLAQERGISTATLYNWRSACEGANDCANASEREHRQAVREEKVIPPKNDRGDKWNFVP